MDGPDTEILKRAIDDNWTIWMDDLVRAIEIQYPSMKALVGQVMRLSGGKANPLVAKRLLVEWLLKENFHATSGH